MSFFRGEFGGGKRKFASSNFNFFFFGKIEIDFFVQKDVEKLQEKNEQIKKDLESECDTLKNKLVNLVKQIFFFGVRS